MLGLKASTSLSLNQLFTLQSTVITPTSRSGNLSCAARVVTRIRRETMSPELQHHTRSKSSHGQRNAQGGGIISPPPPSPAHEAPLAGGAGCRRSVRSTPAAQQQCEDGRGHAAQGGASDRGGGGGARYLGPDLGIVQGFEVEIVLLLRLNSFDVQLPLRELACPSTAVRWCSRGGADGLAAAHAAFSDGVTAQTAQWRQSSSAAACAPCRSPQHRSGRNSL